MTGFHPIRSRTPFRIVAQACLVASSIALGAPSAARANGVPTPTVSLPPDGEHGFPFQSEAIDFDRYGYVEEEFFIEGTARSYVPVEPLDDITDGQWNATPTGPTATYKTRLLIRRPANPHKFNGLVIFDWMNVSAGYDNDGFGGLSGELLRGYAYVGVSAQAVGVEHLPTWDAERYASLDHPGDSFSYDIYSQAAQAVLDPHPGDPRPLGDLTSRIKTIFTYGASQSGARLITYANAVQPDADLYDGFLILVANGGSSLSQEPLESVPVPRGESMRYRTDSDTPILHVNSETEFPSSGPGVHSQPDGDRYRLWELAGSAHATRPGIEGGMAKRIKNGLPVGVPPCGLGGGPDLNDLDVSVSVKAAVYAIGRWSRWGIAPLSAPRAELVVPGDPSLPATIVRDPDTGIALGGIRVPDVAVPTRTLWGQRPQGDPFAGLCFLYGSVDPWNGDTDPYDGGPLDVSPTPEPSLAERYPTHGHYVSAVAFSAIYNVFLGHVRPYDAVQIIKQAAAAEIP